MENKNLTLESAKKNRIALRLLKSLSDHGLISDFEEVKKNNSIYIFEAADPTNIKNEVANILKYKFPENYLFDLTGPRLGFVFSFKITHNNKTLFVCYHKIKEVRKDGTSAEIDTFNRVKL